MDTDSHLAQGITTGLTICAPMPTDLEAIAEVCRAQGLADDGAPATTPERLRAQWEALGPRLATDMWVVVTVDAAPVVYAELARVGAVFALRLWAPPEHRASGIQTALLSRGERRARAIAREEGAASFKLFAQATSTNAAAQQALAQSGFSATSTFERMQLTMEKSPAEPAAIAGIAIRPFRPGQDEDAVYRADEEAFLDERGKTPRTFEQWSQRLNLSAENFDPSLWLVAWDDGEVAGAALGEASGAVGWIHHVGVRRPWRGRGLGAALTLHALGAFHRRGIHTVRLNVDEASLTHAQQLYRRLGFGVLDTYSNFEMYVSLG